MDEKQITVINALQQHGRITEALGTQASWAEYQSWREDAEFAQAADFVRREFAHGWLRSKISAGSGGMLVAASSRPAR